MIIVAKIFCMNFNVILKAKSQTKILTQQKCFDITSNKVAQAVNSSRTSLSHCKTNSAKVHVCVLLSCIYFAYFKNVRLSDTYM